MDNIKENAFGIVVAILVVGLLVFLYFWVLGPVFGQITDIGKTMESTDLELTGFLATKPKPSQELVDSRTEHQELLKTALENAESFYATKYQRFVNFIAFGLAGSLLVTQLLVITNLLNRPTNFELFLYTPEGILFTTLVFTIAALRSKTINLTQAIPAAIRTEADVLPEFFFGTGRIVSDHVCTEPETIPSARPSWTIIVPK